MKKHEEKATTSKKYLLWVLDEGNKKERSDLLSVQANGERNEMKKSDCQLLLEEVLGWDYSKVLIASRKSQYTTEGTRVSIIEPLLGKAGITERTRVNTIEPLLGNEASKLLKDRVGKNVSASPGFLELLKAIKGWEKGVLPADVIMISGAINCLAEKEATISEKLKAALNAAVNGLKTLQQRGFTERYYGVFNFEAALNEAAKGQTELQHSGLTKDDVEVGLNAANDLKQLLHCVIEEFSEREEFRANHMIDCFWLSRDFFHKSIGSVHYNELITYWILEGCFDPVDHLEKAYDQGHYVLMKLIDFGMLRMQDDNAIFMEGLTLNIKDERCYGISATANLRLATSMFETEKWEGFGRVAPSDGMIKTLRVGEEEKLVSTLLVNGSRLCKEIPKVFFRATHKLQVLGIFDSMIQGHPFSESETMANTEVAEKRVNEALAEVQVLVLRRCDILMGFNLVKKLNQLTALEISGATCLKEIPDDIFQDIARLQSLNLSRLPQIESLPSTLSNLTELRRLILRRCSRLQTVPSVRDLTHLEVLDFSECVSLEKMADMSLQALEELQILNLSRTKLQRMPIVRCLKNLTRLLLKGCDNLGSLRLLKDLSGLKFLDLSGIRKIKEMHDDCFQGTDNLEVLDLSKTEVKVFPPHFCTPRVLKLKDCFNLETLPHMTERLESLDLSNASSLESFDDKSFSHLKNLHHLNLSKTKVKELPSLEGLDKLEDLFLEGCSSLEIPPKMKGLSGLKVFKLSGCKTLQSLPCSTDLQNLEDLVISACEAVSEIPDNYFECLTQLQKLSLSGCKKLIKLPRLRGLQNLKDLDLSGCEALSKILDNSFEHMTQLEKLNFSGTQINSLPSLFKPSKLHALVLRNCKNLNELPDLKSLPKLRTLDLFGATNLSEVETGSLNHLTQLQVLGLSNITVEKFPSVSILTNLKGLSLNGCPEIKKESWKALTGLEVLELSGTGITNLPDEFSEMVLLRRLHLPDLKLLQEFGWEKVKRLPGDLDWDECNIPDKDAPPSKPFLMVHGTGFFKRLKDRSLLDNIPKLFKQVVSSVYSSKMQAKEIDYHQHNFSDVHFQIRDFPQHEQRQCLEIQGFDEYPTGIEDVLKQAERISLVENKFLSFISDLHSENLKSTKSCWLERCTEVKSIYEVPNAYLKPEKRLEAEEKMEFAENLEILRISSLPKLRSFYEGKVQCFKNLKELYIDYCPMLETVFSSNQILENLETLQIKFCEILKTVFGQGKAPDGSVQFASASKLKHLYICHCPVLETVFSSPLLPKELETVKIKFCDKLQSVFGNEESANSDLLKVSKLYLSELPELRTIGVKLLNCVPPVWEVINCTKLQRTENSEPTNASEEITVVGDH
ncbi:hypothetical protein SLE2022_224130 [Rubroshorea leprosula]